MEEEEDDKEDGKEEEEEEDWELARCTLKIWWELSWEHGSSVRKLLYSEREMVKKCKIFHDM